jgi:hypothetical protein
MNAMGHGTPNVLGSRISDSDSALGELLPGIMNMGADGMSAHQEHVEAMNLAGPANTLPMMGGTGPFGALEMGGMFTVVKARHGLADEDFGDPGWYSAPAGTVAKMISEDPDFGAPVRRPTT